MRDLELLEAGAREAGDIALRHWRKSPETWDKGDGAGPVTEADLAVDRHLRESFRKRRSDYGWLSEETKDTPARFQAEQVFIVDPIDGTRAFIAGERNWSHSLAIARNGRIVAAAIYVPAMEQMFLAEEGRGATLNGEVISASTQSQLDNARVLSARPNVNPDLWGGQAPGFSRHFRPSLAYRLALVAQGRYDAMISFRKTWEWDIAAGCLVVKEAGGQATDQMGRDMVFNSEAKQQNGIIAAPRPLAEEMQKRLTLPAS